MQGEAGKETARDSPPASWLLVLAAAVTLAAVRRS
jgi:MYXO-CTERM domain-containing protein